MTKKTIPLAQQHAPSPTQPLPSCVSFPLLTCTWPPCFATPPAYLFLFSQTAQYKSDENRQTPSHPDLKRFQQKKRRLDKASHPEAKVDPLESKASHPRGKLDHLGAKASHPEAKVDPLGSRAYHPEGKLDHLGVNAFHLKAKVDDLGARAKGC
jgi:hypothetical protein